MLRLCGTTIRRNIGNTYFFGTGQIWRWLRYSRNGRLGRSSRSCRTTKIALQRTSVARDSLWGWYSGSWHWRLLFLFQIFLIAKGTKAIGSRRAIKSTSTATQGLHRIRLSFHNSCLSVSLFVQARRSRLYPSYGRATSRNSGKSQSAWCRITRCLSLQLSSRLLLYNRVSPCTHLLQVT